MSFWLLSSSPAFAQAAPGGASPGIMNFVPIIFMVVIFYFLIMRPQAKKQKVHQEFLAGLKRGDSVITASGIMGTIEGLTEQFITLEISPGVRIKMLKSQVASPMNTESTTKASN
jgi:preprotein translocase subunit YajC